MKKKLLSVVIPIYNEEKGIDHLHKEVSKVLKSLDDFDYEIIYVNDGSRDGSVLELAKVAARDKQAKVIDFARNFGKEIALSAGCHHVSGDAVITMDADLQHPPAMIPELIAKWQAGFDVVYTVRKENKGVSLTKKWTSKLYWWLFSKVSQIDCEPHSTDFRIMDKKVIEIFKKFPERGRIFRGIIDWIGFKRARLEFVADERMFGTATYSYRKLIDLALNSLTSFSLLPLRMAGYLGVLITSFSFLFILVMFVVRWFVDPLFFSSLAFVIIFNTFLIGLLLICLGFIALYIARIHDEVIDRPLYIIREKCNLDKEVIHVISEEHFHLPAQTVIDEENAITK